MWTGKSQEHLSTTLGKAVKGGEEIRDSVPKGQRSNFVNNTNISSSKENHPLLSPGEMNVFYYVGSLVYV